MLDPFGDDAQRQRGRFGARMAGLQHSPFVPAKAGTQRWIPAFAGMNGECAKVAP